MFLLIARVLSIKKLSIVSVVIHFINKYNNIVTRLISLLKLLNYKKASISK